MLVCNVSLRPPRGAISGTIAETASADATTAALAVYAALVDDPAAALETLDGNLGELIIEAASASDTVDLAGATYAAAVDEAATAGDAPDGTVSGAVIGRSAMLPGVFVNPGASREANVNGIMVNQ